MPLATAATNFSSLEAQPNELDRRRIERTLEARQRYRYVRPKVLPVAGGYEIKAPCCSRNIDPDGGEIDIARLTFDAGRGVWRLSRRDHAHGEWEVYGIYVRLHELLAVVNEDPDRRIWQ